MLSRMEDLIDSVAYLRYWNGKVLVANNVVFTINRVGYDISILMLVL
jgi:hypothetical protein